MDLLAIKCLFAKLIIPLNHDELSLLMQYLEISIREYKYNPSLFRGTLKHFRLENVKNRIFILE